MKNQTGTIIYIGKAKHLKNRVTSYFREGAVHLPKVARMVSQVYEYDYIATDTEYEALVLECSQIKQHKPKYNILLKDDKGYHYIHISDEAYPRITAEKNQSQNGKYLGPYTSGFVTKNAVEEVNRVFQLPTCYHKFPRDFRKIRPCLNYHMGQCMGVCRGSISEKQYRERITEAEEYIRKGGKESVLKMQKDMERAAEQLDFEKAAMLRDRIRAIQQAAETQKIIGDSERDVDVCATVQGQDCIVVSVLIYRGGRLCDQENETYPLEQDESFLEDFLLQFYGQRENIPKKILLERALQDQALFGKYLKEKSGHGVEIIIPQRGSMLELLHLAKKNAGEHLALQKGRTAKEMIALEQLSSVLGMSTPPCIVEAYDISNLASSNLVAGMVVFENGRPSKKDYRRFSMQNSVTQDDYACMHEVIYRRLKHALEGDSDESLGRIPNLILVDGGIGQVHAAKDAIEELGISVPVFGMVKDQKHRTRAIASEGGEISLTGIQAAFHLLTRIQDEVHRYSVSYMHKKHTKQSFSLQLTKIKGIGEKKAQKILLTYKTKKALYGATAEDLAKVAGVSLEIAGQLYEWIQEGKEE